MEWLPIETAPKDGSLIIVSGIKNIGKNQVRNYLIVYWDGEEWVDMSGKEDSVFEYEWNDIFGNLTHWAKIDSIK